MRVILWRGARKNRWQKKKKLRDSIHSWNDFVSKDRTQLSEYRKKMCDKEKRKKEEMKISSPIEWMLWSVFCVRHICWLAQLTLIEALSVI